MKPKFDPYKAGLEAVEELKTAEGGAIKESELKAILSRDIPQPCISWVENNTTYYPKWQFTEEFEVIPCIKKILNIFDASDDKWRVMRYFLASRFTLKDNTPLNLIRQEQGDKVIEHAKIHFEANTW